MSAPSVLALADEVLGIFDDPSDIDPPEHWWCAEQSPKLAREVKRLAEENEAIRHIIDIEQGANLEEAALTMVADNSKMRSEIGWLAERLAAKDREIAAMRKVVESSRIDHIGNCEKCYDVRLRNWITCPVCDALEALDREKEGK